MVPEQVISVQGARDVLLSAEQLLLDGEPVQAEVLARHGLELAGDSGDRRLIAQAHLTCGRACEFNSHLRNADQFYRQSALLYEELGDEVRRGLALGHLSYTRSALGDPEGAFASAQLSAQLREDAEDPALQAQGLNQLGMAALAVQRFDEAEAALEAAAWYANLANPGASFHPVANLCLNEVQRIVHVESLCGEPQSMDRLMQFLARARRSLDNEPLPPFKRSHHLGVMLYYFCCCFVAARQGNVEDARRFAAKTKEAIAKQPANSWVHTFAEFANMYVALAKGDAPGALGALGAAKEHAVAGEHLALATYIQGLGVRLRAQLQALQAAAKGGQTPPAAL